MRRVVAFLFFIIGIAGLLYGVIRLVTRQLPKDGSLRVTSDKPSVIFIDGKEVGRESFENAFPAGEYTVRIVPDTSISDLQPWQGTVTVRSGALTYLSVHVGDTDFTTGTHTLWLEKISGNKAEVSFVTNPDGASILLNGQEQGKAPLVLEDVPVGKQSVSVSSVGYTPMTVSISPVAGYKLVASVKLAISPYADALIPNSDPSEATSSGQGTDAQVDSAETQGDEAADEENTPRPYVLIEETPTGFLRVRMEPTTSASEAARVRPGETYPYLGEEDGWFNIRYEDESEGWVSGEYATLVE